MAIGSSVTCPCLSRGRWHVHIDAVTAFQNITLEDDFDLPAR
jgi:hypothetical protein